MASVLADSEMLREAAHTCSHRMAAFEMSNTPMTSSAITGAIMPNSRATTAPRARRRK
jgi:hypothetical protein